MELLLLPFIVAALWLALRNRSVFAAGALALATGAKLWPALLLPYLLRREIGRPGRLAAMLGFFGGLVGLALLPLLWSGLHGDSGLRAYAGYWQMNDSLYLILHAAASRLVPEHSHAVTRAAVAVLLLALVSWFVVSPTTDKRQLTERVLWTVAALFLLSPTQFPWYALWFLPLLAVHPSPGLLLLTVLLPLYYLRFPMQALGRADWFDYGLVWLQFVPVYMLLAWEWWRRRYRKSGEKVECHAE